MKKTTAVVFALLLVVPIRSLAQRGYAVDRGSMIIGGSAGFTSYGGEELRGDERTTVITVNPHLFFFVAPHIAIGGTVNFVNWSRGESSDSFLGIGPTVAYFFGDESSKTYPFLSGSFIYSSDVDEFTKTDFRFAGGAAFMIAKNVAITGNAFYLLENLKPEGADESASGNTFGIEFGIAAFVF